MGSANARAGTRVLMLVLVQGLVSVHQLDMHLLTYSASATEAARACEALG